MITLIILLPLLGSLFFLPIKEDNFINSSLHSSTVNSFSKNNSIIKQIGLSTSLIVLLLTFYLFISKNLWSAFPSTTLDYEALINAETMISSVNQTPSLELGLLTPTSINYLDSIDNISLFYLLLTAFITPICLLSNWNDINIKRKYFVFSFLLLETLQMSFFLVSDLLLFYIYFESVLIPLFMIIGIWGASKARIRAAFLLFLYTLAGSLLMLLSILWISYNIGITDFNYLALFDLGVDAQGWAWLAFFITFAVKSPLMPFHLWLFRAHAEAPLSGSILLAAVILKLATYGFIRVLLGILPEHCANNNYIIQSLAVITLIYSSLVTCRQTDLKALVAYSSVAHLSVVNLGLFSNNVQGIEGAILLSLAHGFVSPALFIFVGGIIYSRYHTRIINYYRGLTVKMPVFSILFFVFIIFNASAPLSLNFVGEFLTLAGVFQNSPAIGILASTGIVFSAIYSIFLYNRVSFLGFSPYLNSENINIKNNNNKLALGDLNRLEFHLLLPLLLATVILGLFPNFILDLLHYDVTELLYSYETKIEPRELYFSLS